MSTAQRFAWLDGLATVAVCALAIAVLPPEPSATPWGLTARIAAVTLVCIVAFYYLVTPNLYSNVARRRPEWARPTRCAHLARARVCDTHATTGSACLLPGFPSVMSMKDQR